MESITDHLSMLPKLPVALDDVPPTALLATGGALALSVFLVSSNQSRRIKDKKAFGDAKEPLRLPDSSFLFGDILTLARNEHRFHDWMTEVTIQLGCKPWMLCVPGQNNLIILPTPEAMEDVLATQFEKFPYGESRISKLETVLGQSILNSDGMRWYHQRKTAAKFFTAKSLRTCMVTSMKKNVYQMYEVIDKAVASHGSVDLDKLFHEFALQTFFEVGLGVELRWIGSNELNPMERSVDAVSTGLLRRFRLPAFVSKIKRFANVGSERALAEAMDTIHTWIRSVIDKSLESARKAQSEREARVDKSNQSSQENDIKSIMELFLEQSGENVEGMGPDDLVDFIYAFVHAAFDTSALALTWFFLMMSKYPHVEAKIREEMAAVLPSMGVTAESYLTTDHTQKLVFLEATIKEVLRLYPPSPTSQRQAAEDTVIAGNTLIRKGDMIAIATYTMARLPTVWGPDAAEFKPERWIDPATGELRSIPSSKFTTFSSGPRTCLGKKLAMLELRVVTANILHRYNFELAQPNDGSHLLATALKPKYPVLVNATRRSVAHAA